MSREFREIVCMNCFDVFTVNTETNHPWKCAECREPIEATIDQWHDFIAMNANEVVFDPTPEESDRILRESAVEFTECEKSSPEDLDNDLIADLKQQLDTALADLENEREAGDAMMKQLDEAEKSKDYWYESAGNGWGLASTLSTQQQNQQKKHISQQVEVAQELNLVHMTLARVTAERDKLSIENAQLENSLEYLRKESRWYEGLLCEKIWQYRNLRSETSKWQHSWLHRIWAWWTAATYAHSYGDRC